MVVSHVNQQYLDCLFVLKTPKGLKVSSLTQQNPHTYPKSSHFNQNIKLLKLFVHDGCQIKFKWK